jgi:GxxExxY protein
MYKGHCVGEYFADLLVQNALVIEIKCVDRLANEHMAQRLNYLEASELTICLLVNFQKPKVEWKRLVSGCQSPNSTATPSIIDSNGGKYFGEPGS